MQLIIDIGNTSVKYYCAGREFLSLDELGQSRHCEPAGRSNPLEALIISTVPAKNNIEQDNFIIWAEKQGIAKPQLQVYDPVKDSKITKIYAGIGADRIAKLDAARARHPARDIIIFDFGTATTMTVCSAAGELLGGYIALGFLASLKTLGNCAELPSIDVTDVTDLRIQSRVQNLNLGNTTNEAILNGTLLAHQGMIDAWLNSACAVTKNAVTIATGGSRDLFKDKFDHCFSAACLFSN